MLKRLLTVLFFLISFWASAQQKKIDSLEQALRKGPDDSTAIYLYNCLAFYSKDLDLAQMKAYANKALQLSLRSASLQGEAESYNSLGLYHDYKNNYDSAIFFFNKGLSFFPSIHNPRLEGNLLNNLGNLYDYRGEYDKCLEYYLKALKVREGPEGTQAQIAGSYANIGGVHYSRKDYKQALSYFNKALELELKNKNQQAISRLLNNIGNVYKSTNNPDSALAFYKRALQRKNVLNEKRGIAVVYTNISGVYSELKNYPESIRYGLEALKLFEELEDKTGMVAASANLGSGYSKNGEYAPAFEYLNKALLLAEQIGNIGLITEVSKMMAEYYDLRKDYKKAYEFHRKYSALRDSTLNEENSRQINEMSAKYETEKKDKELIRKDAEIKVQEADSKQKSIQRNAFIIGFLCMIALTLLVFRSYRQKQKANEIIVAQKKEVEEQKLIVQEKNKEIVDSINYAQRIQQAVLPAEEELRQVFPDSFVFFQPKDIVSGDFYWISRVDGSVFFTAADCTGHGVPGGFMSMLGMSILNEVINEKKVSEPSEVLELMRSRLIHSLKQKGKSGENKDGMDMVLCRMNESMTELVFAAANNPLWLIRDGRLSEYEPDKQPVGISAGQDLPFRSQRIELRRHDRLYIFTDGFADQFGGPKGKKFKYKPLKELLLAHHSLSMKEQQQLLHNTFQKWRGGLEQVDDVLIIGVRIEG